MSYIYLIKDTEVNDSYLNPMGYPASYKKALHFDTYNEASAWLDCYIEIYLSNQDYTRFGDDAEMYRDMDRDYLEEKLVLEEKVSEFNYKDIFCSSLNEIYGKRESSTVRVLQEINKVLR